MLAVSAPGDSPRSDDVAGHVKILSQGFGPLRARVEPCEYAGKPANAQLPEGATCRPVYVDYGSLRVRVAADRYVGIEVSRGGEMPSRTLPEPARVRLADVLRGSEAANLPFRFVEPPERPDWLVRAADPQAAQVYLVPATGMTSEEVPKVLGPFPAEPELLGQRLRGIAQFRQLLQVVGKVREQGQQVGDAVDVSLELRRLKSPDDDEGTPLADAGGRPDFRDGDLVGFLVSNKGRYPADVTLLFLDSSFGIEALFPVEPGINNRLKPGQKLLRRARINASTTGEEHMVLIAVKAGNDPLCTDFTFLAQPTIDRAKGEGRAHGTDASRGFDSPLGELVQNALYAEGKTRRTESNRGQELCGTPGLLADTAAQRAGNKSRTARRAAGGQGFLGPESENYHVGYHCLGSGVGPCTLIIALLGGSVASAGDPQDKPVTGPRMSREARLVATGPQLFRLVERPGPLPSGELRVNDEREKGGPAGEVFVRVAPAIVFILAEHASGTGFIVDSEGRILTNHHVVAEPGLDDETGARRVQVHLGLLDPKDLTMRVIKGQIPALIYKEDPVRDLAMLKLTAIPPEVKSLTKIDLAASGPRPTDECIAIGHPSGGQLWTVRVGHVTGTGRWPGDYIDETIQILAAPSDQRPEIERRFRSAPGKRVVLSDCVIGHGDSGGPLLDTSGRLIGVTYAGPGDPEAAKLSYHIHLDEVRSFLADLPSKPLMYEPDPWSRAVIAEPPLDFDRDGKPETLIVWSGRDKLSAILVDLDQQSRIDKTKLIDLEQIKRDWHATFAVTFLGGRPYQTFYDTDGDRIIDLVLTAPLVDPGANKADDRPIAAIRRQGRTMVQGPGPDRSPHRRVPDPGCRETRATPGDHEADYGRRVGQRAEY